MALRSLHALRCGLVSDFRLQVIHAATGKPVLDPWHPGSAIETDLVDDLAARLKGKGIGYFKTEAKVLEGLRSAFVEMLYDLKRRV